MTKYDLDKIEKVALRDAEKLKITCAKKHFEALALEDFRYDVKTTYEAASI